MFRKADYTKKRRFFINVLITVISLVCSAIICLFMTHLGLGDFYVPLIFVLCVLIVALFTDGYVYGIIASIAAVFGVNFAFTYPYFQLNFSISGYPVTFITMLAVSITTSMLMTRVKLQEKLTHESEKEKMRANLLRAVSHDLRTPLTSIIGAVDAVLESDNNMSIELEKEILNGAKDDAQWLIRMVENLLTVTRMSDTNEAVVNKEPEAIEEILSEASAKFRKRFSSTKVSVCVPDELLLVPMDAMLIEQVLINLMENAVIHGGTTTIKITVTSLSGVARFTVSDNGNGLSSEDMTHLFDGYYGQHGDHFRNGHKSNMGIGLSVCMTIIKAHGGQLTAENNPDGGASFSFTLPL